MFALLPLLCWLFIFLNLSKARGNHSVNPRETFLLSSILWGFYLVISTEILSALKLLSFVPVCGSWAIALAVSLGFLLAHLKKNPKIPLWKIPKLFPHETVLLSCLGLIIFLIGLMAWITPPNNWDSLTYHMGRVAHWVQNQTLANYPTGIPRQLTHTPGAEYIILHFQILSGTDRFANLVQWYSMVGSILGITLIAKQFGANRSEQIFSAIIAGTIPMGILQAASTQNDYVLTFWLVCSVYFLIEWKTERKWIFVIAASASMGLSILTKGTSYVYLLPFILWHLLTTPFKEGRQTLKFLAFAGLCVVLLNGAYFIRKAQFYQNIQDLFYETKVLRNDRKDGLTILSNTVKNISIHLATPLQPVNRTIESAIRQIHSLAKMDINDPQTNAGDFTELHFNHSFHEDQAGNPLHLIFGIACLFLLFSLKAQRQNRIMREYAIAMILAFVLFNLILKWQVWNARLHLPLFVLGAPIVGTILTKIFSRNFFISLATFFLLMSLPWVFLNEAKPILKEKNIFNTPRIEQYFANNPGFYFSYHRTAQYLKDQGCSQIGLFLDGDTWEYPLWVMLKEVKMKNPRLEHTWIPAVSHQKPCAYPLGTFAPCAIVDDKGKDHSQITFENIPFTKTKETAFLRVFLRDTSGALVKRIIASHIYRALSLANQDIRPGQSPNEQIKEEIILKREALKEASLVDLKYLSRMDSVLANRFENDFMGGLQLLINSFEEKSQIKYNHGILLLLRWNSWVQENPQHLQNISKE